MTKTKRRKKSMAGYFAKWKLYKTREDILKDLRDKTDRAL